MSESLVSENDRILSSTMENSEQLQNSKLRPQIAKWIVRNDCNPIIIDTLSKYLFCKHL